MVKNITHFGKFLVISENYDGYSVSTCINVDQIISIVFGSSIVTILCDGDVEYEWSLNLVQIVMFKRELFAIVGGHCEEEF